MPKELTEEQKAAAQLCAQKWYQAHKEQRKEYQREYRRKHKEANSGVRGQGRMTLPSWQRPKRQETFNPHDIMTATDDKAVRMLSQILSYERGFTL